MMLFRANFLLFAIAATPFFVAHAQHSDAPSLTPVVHYSSNLPSDVPSTLPSDVPSTLPSDVPSAVVVPAVNHYTALYQHGPAGSITVFNSQNGDDWESDPHAVTLTLDYLYELDANDTVVGIADSHIVETFATQDFTVSSTEMTELYGFTASAVSFATSVSNVGTVKIDTYILDKGGVMQTDTNETFQVSPGYFVFNMELLDWSWCDPCTEGTSTHMDVGVEIRGSKERPTLESLGGGIPLILSRNIRIDNQIVPMPAGFPKIVNQGGKSIFVFRLPKNGAGSDSYSYDLIIGMGQQEEEDDSLCQGLFCFCR